MAHIFISYSHDDIEYVRKLASHLQEEGFETWVDMRLDYGSRWPHELQEKLDGCDAFILIMSPRSFASDWVQSELSRAKRKHKPIFPMLLEGDEPWLSVEAIQYFDIRDGSLPDRKFYSALERVIKRGKPSITDSLTKPVRTPPLIKKTISTPRYGAIILVVILCGFTAVGAIMIPIIWSALSPEPTSVPTPTRVIPPTGTALPATGTRHPPTTTLEPTATFDTRPRTYDFQACATPCNGQNNITSFASGISKIYFQFNYENFKASIPYTRTWSMNGREWIRYTCNWDGPSAGTEPLKLTEPKGLAAGTWTIRVLVDNELVLEEEIVLVGNHDYWDPAGTINACHGTN